MTTMFELEDQIRGALRQLENPLLDKGSVRVQLLKVCAKYLDTAEPFEWTVEQITKTLVELREGTRIWATVSWADLYDTQSEILHIGGQHIFIRDANGEGIATIGQVDPRTLRYTAEPVIRED